MSDEQRWKLWKHSEDFIEGPPCEDGLEVVPASELDRALEALRRIGDYHHPEYVQSGDSKEHIACEALGLTKQGDRIVDPLGVLDESPGALGREIGPHTVGEHHEPLSWEEPADGR